VCPQDVFEQKDNKAIITDRDRCMECGACMNNCAFGALSVDSGVGCAAALFYSIITGNEPACDCQENGGCC
jgi:Fe-S-cluster-containing hydrogenase component 2